MSLFISQVVQLCDVHVLVLAAHITCRWCWGCHGLPIGHVAVGLGTVIMWVDYENICLQQQ